MTDRPDALRRALLTAAPVGMAASAVAAAPEPEREHTAEPEDPRQVRLHDSAHVRTFYHLARS